MKLDRHLSVLGRDLERRLADACMALGDQKSEFRMELLYCIQLAVTISKLFKILTIEEIGMVYPPSLLLHALVLAGILLIFFIVASIEQCFGSVLETVLVTQRCSCYC